MSRVHFLVDDQDKARWTVQAAREGLSLGAWLREAAEVRYRTAQDAGPFSEPAQLDEFFAQCDEMEQAPEPDWAVHKGLLDRSFLSGAEPT